MAGDAANEVMRACSQFNLLRLVIHHSVEKESRCEIKILNQI